MDEQLDFTTYRRPRRGLARNKHEHALNYKPSPTYKSWESMRQRCFNSNAPNYDDYGGRGIGVTKRWRSFEGFLADMGVRPEGTTLDRKDPNGHYTRENCRWASELAQQRNRRSVKLTTNKARQMRLLVEMGYSQAFVGRAYGVSPATTCWVVKGKAWGDSASNSR